MSANKTKKKAKTRDKIEEEFNEILLVLQDMQNRAGKEPLTHQQRCSMLNEIYDGTLITLRRHLMMGVNKGTSAAVTMLERSRLELIGLEEMLVHTREIEARANGESSSTQHSMAYELPPVPKKEIVEA
jgi:hypothetical protein